MLQYFLNYIISHRLQLTKFFFVGLTTCFIYSLLFHLFYGIVQIDYRLAASIAYIVTVFAHFHLHRTFTFKGSEQTVGHNIWKYIFMLILNYINMLTIMWLLVDMLKISPYLSLIASTGVTASVSFLMMKYFVFKSNTAMLYPN